MRREAFSELPQSAQHRPSGRTSEITNLSPGSRASTMASCHRRRPGVTPQPNCPRLPYPSTLLSAQAPSGSHLLSPEAPPPPPPLGRYLGLNSQPWPRVLLLAGYLPRIQDRCADQLCSSLVCPPVQHTQLRTDRGGGGRGRQTVWKVETTRICIHTPLSQQHTTRREGSEVRRKRPHSLLGARVPPAALLRL